MSNATTPDLHDPNLLIRPSGDTRMSNFLRREIKMMWISLSAVEGQSHTPSGSASRRLEFHISRKARKRYRFDDSLFTLTGNVIFADFYAVRLFAQRLNERRNLVNFPENAVKAGQINAMGLIDEILHYVVGLYIEQKSSRTFKNALLYLQNRMDPHTIDEALERFIEDFPPLALYKGDLTTKNYLRGKTGEAANREIALEEMIMLWLANKNPGFTPLRELFDDTSLENTTAYRDVMKHLYLFFASQPTFGPDQQNLIDMLRSPARAFPYSLPGQLKYIQERWGLLLKNYFYRIFSAFDLVREEERMAFDGPGEMHIQDLREKLGEAEKEYEKFTPDASWMPRLVLIAKSIYVWLDQLSKKYSKSISTLDQIPDEELDILERYGFTGLWLIGIWERSPASRRIKQMCGNPEALSSAYSLYRYEIARDLGGESALENLKQRALQRGIRLACDMVPNHMGIDSPWVMEHPDWFLSLNHSPYPVYTFNGPDLSSDDRVGIYLEDHYYNRTDAAVVFKRVDHLSGEERFIYHGNDGTRTPWNDTAQLDYLNPEVREEVIRTILSVARKFPIIRFDAAMTLTKRHYHRLWFPQPGSGGDIPSRSDFGMDRADFDQRMPNEFWREVVDRVAKEVPDTLLLAEAFWLMESYFVRTLGMHRVYNSAFMNFLKNEENAKYRSYLKEVLEFNPEILRRYVNFMNNPDEETAVAQFGKGDKYFGICAMMVTMPGLPMFGHGQIEGFEEKYGMEYRKAYRNEEIDEDLVRRHESEIFPLLHKRHLFSDVENFLLYDFFTPQGSVNENVFAYSNRAGDERCLAVYNNAYASTEGWIRASVAYAKRSGVAGEGDLIRKSLGEGLALHNDDRFYTLFKDAVSGFAYIRRSSEFWGKGLYVNLGGYKRHLFLDFKEVEDNEWNHFAHLNDYLKGRGVPSIEDALEELVLQPIHAASLEIFKADLFQRAAAAMIDSDPGVFERSIRPEIEQKTVILLDKINRYRGGSGDAKRLIPDVTGEMMFYQRLEELREHSATSKTLNPQPSIAYVKEFFSDKKRRFLFLLWSFIHHLDESITLKADQGKSCSLLDELRLRNTIENLLRDLDFNERHAWRSMQLLTILIDHKDFLTSPSVKKSEIMSQVRALLKESEIQSFLQVNRYHDILWFNEEAFNDLLNWLSVLKIIAVVVSGKVAPESILEGIVQLHDLNRWMIATSRKSRFQLDRVRQLLKPHPPVFPESTEPVST